MNQDPGSGSNKRKRNRNRSRRRKGKPITLADFVVNAPPMAPAPPRPVAQATSKSILRTTNSPPCGTIKKTPRNRVQFASEGARGAATVHHLSGHQWKGVNQEDTYTVLKQFRKSCRLWHVPIVRQITDQIQEIQNNTDYSAELNLHGLWVTKAVIENLEIAFQLVTFDVIYLYVNNITGDSAIDLLEMINFYDPVRTIIFANCPRNLDYCVWDIISHTIKTCTVLSTICFRQFNVDEDCASSLFNVLNSQYHVLTLQFQGCQMNTLPNFDIAFNLDQNTTITTLNLTCSNLTQKEAEAIGRFISTNTILKELDMSGNPIGDHGFDYIVRGLCELAYRDFGLDKLSVCYCCITTSSVLSICSAIANCPLKILNLGHNALTDVVVVAIKNDIATSTTLESLGLSATGMSSVGLYSLAEACLMNTSLRHLNLTKNVGITIQGLHALSECIPNSDLIQIDLDERNRVDGDSFVYSAIVEIMNDMLNSNYARLYMFSGLNDHVPDNADNYAYDLTFSEISKSRLRRFQVVNVPENDSDLEGAVGLRSSIRPF